MMLDDSERIKFIGGEFNAYKDKCLFNAWENKLISTYQAKLELEARTGTKITKEQFVKNANWLGYFRDRGKL